MQKLKKIALLSVLALMGASGAGAQAAKENAAVTETNMPSAVVTVEGITEYRLPNGLRVVLYPDESKPTATVNMTYLVGSRNENYGETGMAHLLEHLMFKGSKNFPDPDKEFTRRGFRMNGNTWLDRTTYFVSFTANDDNMKWALAWQADAMVNSFIARKDLDTEMTVVRNEYEMGENRPMSVLLKRMQSVLFDWHSYGRSTIGARSDIENVEIANLQAFYHKYYQPDNAVLTVSGKFDREKVLAWIAEDFGPIPKPARVLPKEWTVEPTADGEREFYVRRPGETQMIMVGYRTPAALSPDFSAVSMAADIIGDTPSGRLYKGLVETGLATQVYGWASPTKQPGYVVFGATVKMGEPIEPVKKKLVEIIENTFKEKAVTPDEIGREKTDAQTAYERLLADPEEFAVELTDYIGLGDWRLFFAERDAAQKTTAKEIADAAAKYFVRDNRVVGIYEPTDKLERAEIAQPPTAEEVLKHYTFSEKGQDVEAFDVSQDNINARTRIVTAGNVKFALLPKKTRSSTVTVQMNFLNGDSRNTADAALNMLTSSMLTRGTKTMTREQISDEFIKLRMDGSPFGFQTDREHLIDALRLAGSLFSGSSFPEKEFDTLKRQAAVSIKAKSDDPATLARDAVIKHFNTYPEGDSRHQMTTPEMLKAIDGVTLDKVKKQWHDVFGTTRGYIAVVGDFDADEVEAALKKDVVGVKKPVDGYVRAVSEFRPVKAERIVIDTPEKENAVLLARADFAANSAEKDMPALITANWIMGGSSGLYNRIINRLRQKEGLSYGAGSSLRVPDFGNRGRWTVYAIVAPQNLKQAEASLRDEIAKAFKEGLTQKELDEAKKGIIDSRAVNRAQDSVLAANWLSLLETDRDWTYSKQTEEAIKALTLEDLNKALRRFADPAKITFVLAGDRAKARAAGKDFAEP
jgi:zinc protease